MKKSLLLAILFFSSSLVFAQNELLVQNGPKGLYLEHTVVSGENYYSIGRRYNISPKDLAAFNSLDMKHGLLVGQALQIPLKATNFNQKLPKGRPVYYTVEPAEGLYRVSMKNNKVLMAYLRKWNHLANDNISTGQLLIVGYLVSPEADKIIAEAPVKENTVAQEIPVITASREEVKNVQANDVASSGKEESPKKQETEKIADPVKKQEPERRTEPEKRTEAAVTKPVSDPAPRVAVTDGSGGYFKSQYELQTRTQPLRADMTASAGIFKTASGWQDAKYYALMDGVEPGTIIRVINPTNNKAIYAKVLGEMSGIRQNQGYDVRISNAAASALEVSDTDKFIVRVNH